MPITVGIDLGTIYSVIAWVPSYGGPEVISGTAGEALTPSVVSFATGVPVVGAVAQADQARGEPEVAAFFKASMGDPAFTRSLGGQEWSAAGLSGLVLAHLKAQAEQALGHEVTTAVIAVPEYFAHPQRIATMEAGRRAGLDVLRIISEPAAAALAYGLRPGARTGHFIVYDLGGGTFDVSLVKLTAHALAVIAATGDHEPWDRDWDDGAVSAGLLQRTAQLTAQVLDDAGVTWADIDGVLPVGGSTRTPMVRQWITGASGREPLTGVDPDHAVALGAAVQAAMLTAPGPGLGPVGLPGRPLLPESSQITYVAARSLGTIASGTRPNFFIILGLDPAQPWDDAAFSQALSEKRNLWARQVQGIKTHPATIEAQRNLRSRREVERVMRDPQARETERQAAIRERQDELHQRRRVIADQLEDMLEKGYLLDDEYERLQGEEAIRADDTLRQRLEDAERRPRSQEDGSVQRLDQAVEQNLRRYLDVVGQPDLYTVLRTVDPGVGEATPTDRLLEAAGALYQKARNTADKSRPEVGAMQNLSGIARQLLGSPDLKQRHDASVRLWSLDALLDRYESSLEIAREIGSRQFERFLREAAAKGIDIGVARNDLITRFRKRGWKVDVPSAAFEAMLRAEVRCPRCSRLNDPESGHCAYCGRELRGQCPRCGAATSWTARVCPACGFPVGERDYVGHLVERAEACLARGDVIGADEHAAEAGQLWPVPAGSSDDLSDRLRAARERIVDLRAAQRELLRQADLLMDARNYLGAARLLRGVVTTHPGLAGHLKECEDAIRASRQLLRDARAPGLPDEQRAGLYSKALRLCADNDEARSELSLVSLSPVIPAPVSAQGHPPRMSVHEVELDSPPAERGVVKIVCARLDDPSPSAGSEFPEGELERYRTITRGTRDIWISEKEWLRRYTLILVLHDRCYVGGSRWYARGPEVADLRAAHAGTSVRVTWTWPAEAPDGTEVSEALVSWHDGAEIGDPVNATEQEYVSREPGAVTGHCDIPATGRLFIKVAVVVRHHGAVYVTSGVRADARRQPITLRYEVRPSLGRRAKLVISADGGRLDQLPELSLRGRSDNRPASRDGGAEVKQIPAGLAAREISVRLEDMNGRRIEPRSCRLFVAHDPDGTAVRIIDPV